MPPLRKILLTGLIGVFGAISAIALSACSTDNVFGDDNQQVSVSLTERDLKPGQVAVDAGKIDFEVKNDGDRLHEFAVQTKDGVKRITEIKPGDTETFSVDLPVGRYRMYDPRGGYGMRGVAGTVVVTPNNSNTVTERTVERTVTEEDQPDVTVPEPEVQEPPPAPPPPPPPPPVVTQTVPAPAPPTQTTP